jgi:glycosyltransferase involved in cell wall biosynthesis
MRKIRVLHILNSLRPSGAEVMLRVAVPSWIAAGIDVEILSVGETTGPYAPTLIEAGYPIHHLPFAKSVSFFRALYKLFVIGHYDVVHIHTERANFYFAITARIAGVPRIVRTIHNVFPFTGMLGLSRKIQRRVLGKIGCEQISVSQSVATIEQDFYGSQTTQIANWYDSSHFTPPTLAQRAAARAELAIPNSAFVIVSIGNCSEVKNHAELLKAVAVLNRDDLIYLHVGDESDCNERGMASRHEIAESVKFLGALSDVRTPLHAADAFIMPSLHEGCGIAAIEAMACGLPAILSDVAGLEDFKEITGDILWTTPNSTEIAQSLTKAANLDRAQRFAIGHRLHEAVRDQFNIERGVAAYVRVYRGTMKFEAEQPDTAHPPMPAELGD